MKKLYLLRSARTLAFCGLFLALTAGRCGEDSEVKTSREDVAIPEDERFLGVDSDTPASESVPERGTEKDQPPARSNVINDEDALDEDSTYMEPPSSSTDDTDEQ